MRCKKIQELITTNYIDAEISEGLRKMIEEHLNICSKCREFEQALRKVTVTPFEKTTKTKPSEEVWHAVRKKIEGRETKSIIPSLIYKLYDIFRVRKPAFALATVITVILIGLIFTRIPFSGRTDRTAVNLYLEEQAEFFLYLNSYEETEYSEAGYADLGTDIEKYFL